MESTPLSLSHSKSWPMNANRGSVILPRGTHSTGGRQVHILTAALNSKPSGDLGRQSLCREKRESKHLNKNRGGYKEWGRATDPLRNLTFWNLLLGTCEKKKNTEMCHHFPEPESRGPGNGAMIYPNEWLTLVIWETATDGKLQRHSGNAKANLSSSLWAAEGHWVLPVGHRAGKCSLGARQLNLLKGRDGLQPLLHWDLVEFTASLIL